MPTKACNTSRFPLRAAAAAMAAMLLGCGGGGGSGLAALCDPDTFTPSYARQADHLFNWATLPVTVYFTQDSQFSQARRSVALTGFDQWVTATGGKLSYREVSSSTNADVVVRFDASTANGETTSHYSGLELIEADMTLGVKDQAPEDLQCVAAHEFGHALGIDGHSDNSNDLMYPIHYAGTSCPVTQRDLNTMKTGYCHLFGRCVVTGARFRYGPTGTVTIQ